jgi:hypothetical protein
MKGISWITLILGLWVVISPWLVVSVLNMSNVIVGILVILIACVELFGGKSTPQV